jgi:hypothetical protein
MVQFFPVFHEYLFYCLLSFVFFYYVGHLALSFFSIQPLNEWVNLFRKIVTGIILSVTFFALFSTQLKSIYFISFFLLIILAINFKRNTFTNIKLSLIHFEYKTILISLLFLVLFYAICYFYFYTYVDGAIFGDYYFYANLASSLIQNNIESVQIDWSVQNTDPYRYHYTEVWLIALISSIFSINTLPVFFLIILPFFAVSIFVGGISLITLLHKNNVKNSGLIFVVFGFLLLILQNIDIPFVGQNTLRQYSKIGAFVYNPKISIVYIFFLSSFIAAYLNEYKLSFILIVLLVSFYSPITPGIFAGLFVIIIYLRWAKKILIKDFIKYVALLILLSISYILFYYFQSSPDALNLSNVSISFSVLNTIKVFVKLVLFGLMPSLVILYLLFCIKMKKSPLTLYKELSDSFCSVDLYRYSF